MRGLYTQIPRNPITLRNMQIHCFFVCYCIYSQLKLCAMESKCNTTCDRFKSMISASSVLQSKNYIITFEAFTILYTTMWEYTDNRRGRIISQSSWCKRNKDLFSPLFFVLFMFLSRFRFFRFSKFLFFSLSLFLPRAHAFLAYFALFAFFRFIFSQAHSDQIIVFFRKIEISLFYVSFPSNFFLLQILHDFLHFLSMHKHFLAFVPSLFCNFLIFSSFNLSLSSPYSVFFVSFPSSYSVCSFAICLFLFCSFITRTAITIQAFALFHRLNGAYVNHIFTVLSVQLPHFLSQLLAQRNIYYHTARTILRQTWLTL